MSLILTHLSEFGIIHASDSNITSGDNTPAGHGKKTFRVKYLNAGLTVAGAFSVGGKPMDEWMRIFIARQQAHSVKPLAAFASALRTDLEAEMNTLEKKNGSMVHIAGYVEKSGKQHPEFYFVRNIHQMTAEGWYEDLKDQFLVSEDFWTRDCPQHNLMAAFKGKYQLYVNGYPPGRIAYVGVTHQLTDFFSKVWAQPNWKFRSPRSLADHVLFVKLYMIMIGTLFQVSDYPAPYIGGVTQICAIPCPTNVETTSLIAGVANHV